jgi:hypothetical protein
MTDEGLRSSDNMDKLFPQPATPTPVRLSFLGRFGGVCLAVLKICHQWGEECLDASFLPLPENFFQ